MADDYIVYKKCKDCGGTGVVTINDEPFDSGPPEEVTCTRCNGEGKIEWGSMEEIEIE